MKAKRLAIGMAVLGAILACTLPFSSLEEAECVSSGGEWIPEAYDSETDRYIGRYCVEGDQPGVAEAPAGETEGDQAENPPEDPVSEAAGSFFSLVDCQCGVPLPLNENLSSASSKSHPYTSAGGLQVEEAQILTCDWSQDYSSERKTAELSAHFQMVKFTQAEEAQTLYKEFVAGIVDQPQYCNEDRECTIAEEFFNDHRAWFVEKYIFIRGDGVQFPSSHNGYWAGVHTEPPGVFFAWMLYTSHPELELGGTWVEDVTKSVEECVINVIVR